MLMLVAVSASLGALLCAPVVASRGQHVIYVNQAVVSPTSSRRCLSLGAAACRAGHLVASEAASSAAAIKPPTFQPKVVPPNNKADMLAQAVTAVQQARGAGIHRHMLRLFLPRDGELTPPDESWVGGIMQLYAVASPLARELLQKLGVAVAGVPPSLREQRLDSSGVDGESVWMAQSSKPQDDAVGFVQPSTEQVGRVLEISGTAGTRPVLLINPQWKERDDPLDALSRRAGLLGSLGNFLGGKAATEAKLLEQGFTEVYTLAQYRCRGSIICLQLCYPHGWTAFYRQGVDDDRWTPLIASASRPTYQEVEMALQEANVPFRLTEFDSVV